MSDGCEIMPVHRLNEMGSSPSGCVILPKEELEKEGCVESDGSIDTDQMVEVRNLGDGEWKLKLIDPDDYPL